MGSEIFRVGLKGAVRNIEVGEEGRMSKSNHTKEEAELDGIRTTGGDNESSENSYVAGDALKNAGDSTLFSKLREQSIRQVTEMIDSTIDSMSRLEHSMERIGSSTSGVVSAARIWSSFYDPMVVEKLKEESVKGNGAIGVSTENSEVEVRASNQDLAQELAESHAI